MLLQIRNRYIALRVDHIEGVAETEANRFADLPPVFTGKTRTWFPRILIYQEALIPLLDPAGMAGLKEEELPEFSTEDTRILPDDFLAQIITGESLQNHMTEAIQRALADVLVHEMQQAKTRFAADLLH
jgi:chemotaxis signal transduction protein